MVIISYRCNEESKYLQGFYEFNIVKYTNNNNIFKQLNFSDKKVITYHKQKLYVESVYKIRIILTMILYIICL